MVVHALLEVDDADFATYLAWLADLIDRFDPSRRTAALYDVSAASSTSPKRRKQVADVLDPRREKLKKSLVGCAVATPSSVVRGIATALVWVASPPFEIRFVPGPHDAFVWFAKLLPGLDPEVAYPRYQALKKRCREDPTFQ